MRRNSSGRKATVAVTTAAALAAVGAASVATGAIPNADGNIYACVNKNGEVRVQDARGQCKKNWSPLDWQQSAQTPRAYLISQITHVSGTRNPENDGANGSTTLEVVVECDAGDIVTGGGYSVSANVSVGASGPTTGGGSSVPGWKTVGWRIVVTNMNEDPKRVRITGTCLDTA